MTHYARLLLGFLVVAAATGPAGAVEIDWVSIAHPNNPADDTGFGAVPDAFQIGRTEVTVAQYTEFLNAVADSDPGQLWDVQEGVTRTGSDGSYQYSVPAGTSARPVANISFWR